MTYEYAGITLADSRGRFLLAVDFMDSRKCDACGGELPEENTAPLCQGCISELHAKAGFTDLIQQAPVAETAPTLSAAAESGAAEPVGVEPKPVTARKKARR